MHADLGPCRGGPAQGRASCRPAAWPSAGLGRLALSGTHFKSDSVPESAWLPGKRLVRGCAQTPQPPLAPAPGRVPGGRKLATTEGCPGRDNPSKEEGAVLGNELVPPSTGGAGGSCSRGDGVGRGPETRGARRPESAHGRGWACVCTSCTEVGRWCSLSSSVY